MPVSQQRSTLCIVATLLLSIALLRSTAQNLLLNPGFEDGTNGWYVFNEASLMAETAAPFHGTASGSAHLPSNSFGARIIQNVFGQIELGQTYHFGGYFRGTSNATVSLELVYGDGRATIFHGNSRTLSPTWTYFTTQKPVSHANVTGALQRAEVWIRNPSGIKNVDVEFDQLMLSNSSPRLTLTLTNELREIIWPRTATGYVLQATAGFSASNWITINDVQTNDTTFSYLSSTASNSFFRLRRP
jgi:hypothetical protein